MSPLLQTMAEEEGGEDTASEDREREPGSVDPIGNL